MIDFTSSLYLGLRHASGSLRPWAQLTTGRPAALGSPAVAARVERELERLQGVERTALFRSTLHAFWDVFAVAAGAGSEVFVDADAYPIARGAIGAAHARSRARTFPHHGAGSLRTLIDASDKRPIVVTDSYCPSCGRMAPLDHLLALVRRKQGLLIVDDTQGIGILGNRSDDGPPYGWGGGGAARHLGVQGPDVLIVSSLAKAFGAPLACVSGSNALVGQISRKSETRTHASPPTLADLHAADSALRMNISDGEAMRRRLVARVLRFRRGVTALGMNLIKTLFPIQQFGPLTPRAAERMARVLLASGIKTAAVHGHRAGGVAFLIRADMSAGDIDRAIHALSAARVPVASLGAAS